MSLLIGDIPLDKIMFYILFIIVLLIMLVIIDNQLNSKKYKDYKNYNDYHNNNYNNNNNYIEHFEFPNTTKPITPIAPTIQNALATAYSSVNDVRFDIFSNQNKLTAISERINKLNYNLVNITGKPTYSVDGKLNFY